MSKEYVTRARLRKCTDVDREFAIFELVADDRTILLDVSATDEGVLQVFIHEGERYYRFDDLLGWLLEGKRLVEEDMRNGDAGSETS